MIWIIARKEFLLNLVNFRFIAGFILFFILSVLSTFDGNEVERTEIVELTLSVSSYAQERQEWGKIVNGLRCRLLAGTDGGQHNDITALTVEIQNTGTSSFCSRGQIIEGNDNDGQPVKTLASLTIFGVDERGEAFYRLMLPSMSCKYSMKESDMVIRPGESYAMMLPLRNMRVMDKAAYIPVAGGRLARGEHRLVAVVLYDKHSLRSSPLFLTVEWIPS